jgi:tRNA modification GTPase
MYQINRTERSIIAEASPSGGSQRSIIRISGNNSFDYVAQIPEIDISAPERRSLVSGSIRIKSASGVVIVPISMYFLKAPETYTMEDTVEVHLPGAYPLAGEIIKLFCRNGFCLAQPGEFTMRAFLNNRIDLIQAEAVESIISATSESERRAAFSRIEGVLSGRIHLWRKTLVEISSQIEGELDFEQDEVSEMPVSIIAGHLERLIAEISKIYNASTVSISTHGYINVTIVGPTNAGKSSIINSLLGGEFSVVSSEKTTTRDIVEYEMHIEPFHFMLQDSPGYDTSSDTLASLATGRAQDAGELAGVVLLVFDLSRKYCLSYEDIIKDLPDTPLVLIGNKSDLAAELDLNKVKGIIQKHRADLGFNNNNILEINISAKNQINITNLKQSLVDIVINNLEHSAGRDSLNLRVQEELYTASESLKNALQSIRSKALIELVAEDLRAAYGALGHLAGIGYAEEVLESIFSRFCIGK